MRRGCVAWIGRGLSLALLLLGAGQADAGAPVTAAAPSPAPAAAAAPPTADLPPPAPAPPVPAGARPAPVPVQGTMLMMDTAQSRVIRGLLPSVVNITSRRTEEEPEAGSVTAGSESAPAGSFRTRTLSGSGFVIDPGGVIATNWHVVADAFEIYVTFEDGTRYAATLMSASKVIDIALLRVDVGHDLPALSWGSSDTLHVGDPVLAIGNPLGIGMSVSSGIVSALHRDIQESPYDDFIQTDAAINHGNSGGPLFNFKGEVIGINSALFSPTTGSVGLGFAIPSNDAQFVIGRLLRYGWVRPGWLGAEIQQITPDMAAALNMEKAAGSIIAEVVPGGPADKAGLHIGDVILRFGDDTPSDTRALMRDIGTAPLGETVKLAVWRAGSGVIDVPVTIQEWPKSLAEARDGPVKRPRPDWQIPPDLGLRMEAVDKDSRAKFGLGMEQTGVVITGVTAGTDAADRGLVPGDVILRIGETPVATPADVAARLDALRAQKRSFAMVLLKLKKGRRWTALRIGEG